jgi:Holliday junction resolvase RusA-like endonuclease
MGSLPDVRFVIPGPPRGWQRTGQRIAKSKATGVPFIMNYTTNETEADEWLLKRAATEAMGGRKPLDGPIDLQITAWVPVPRSWSKKKQADALDNLLLPVSKPDFDNTAKLVDGIKGVVWRDDCLVANFHYYKRFSAWPRTVIEVRLLQPLRPLRDVLPQAPNEHDGRTRSPLVGSL